MKSMNKTALWLVAAVLIFSTLACSSPATWFATATPTPTDTPTMTLTPTLTNTPTRTATPTSTNTLIPTNTPVAPVTLTACLYWDCPKSKTLTDYLGDAYTKIDPNVTTTLNIASTDSVHFFQGYCGKTKTDLDTSLPAVEFFFYIDGNSYIDSFKGEYYTITAPQDSSVTESCYGMGTVASGWKAGEKHLVSIGIRFIASANDGWNDYPAGVSYPYLYNVVPTEPTPTPLPAAVKPAPVAPSVNCQVNSNIIISNRSGYPFTINLAGPGNFSFSLGAGAYSTVRVCSGSYNYTIYGTCNGAPASGSGRISDGDQVNFICTGG
jgi:hypothetical protein